MHLDKRTCADLDYLKAFAAFLVVLGPLFRGSLCRSSTGSQRT